MNIRGTWCRAGVVAIAAIAISVPLAMGASAPGRRPARRTRAPRAPRVVSMLPLDRVRIVKVGRIRKLVGVPSPRGGRVRWLVPKGRSQQRSPLQVARIWVGVQERRRARATLAGRSVTLINSRVKGIRFEAQILRGTPRVGTRATLRIWTLVGDADGIGRQAVNWNTIRLRPGQAVALSYTKDSDGDGLPDSYEAQIGTNPTNPDTDGDGPSDGFEVQQGWTVPLAQGGSPSYRVLSSPLSCDADGDGSPDGPGAGNTTFGVCPNSGFPPESQRAMTTGQTPANNPRAVQSYAGTDPNTADTNQDGLLDGVEPFPDVLSDVPVGGKVPVFLRQWGGTGTANGAFTHAQGIALDPNSPGFSQATKPTDVYVIDRTAANCAASPCHDRVEKFAGNPFHGVPGYVSSLPPNTDDVGGSTENRNVVLAATGITVAAGGVTTAGGTGSPVIVNDYPKTAASIANARKPSCLLTGFNGTTGEDAFQELQSQNFGVGSYCGAGPFDAPIFAGQIGNGFLDVTSDPQIVLGQALATGVFQSPWGVAADANSDVYVTDEASNLVQFFFYPFGPN